MRLSVSHIIYLRKCPGEIEFHEHLRILEIGYIIRADRVDSNAISVDTQSDLETVRRIDDLISIYG